MQVTRPPKLIVSPLLRHAAPVHPRESYPAAIRARLARPALRWHRRPAQGACGPFIIAVFIRQQHPRSTSSGNRFARRTEFTGDYPRPECDASPASTA